MNKSEKSESSSVTDQPQRVTDDETKRHNERWTQGTIDPMEAEAEQLLKTLGLQFTKPERDPSDPANLDFFVPAWNSYLEVKRYHTPRIAEQLALVPEDRGAIVLMGRPAMHALSALTQSQAATIAELRAEVERQKRRGDNHWETLRGIRQMAREKDFERIILWVDDAGSGYTRSAEATMKDLIDAKNVAESALVTATAQIEKLKAAAKAAREQLVFNATALEEAGAMLAARGLPSVGSIMLHNVSKTREALAALSEDAPHA